MELPLRKDVPQSLTWDLSLIYATEDAMFADADKLRTLCAHMTAAYPGKLTAPETINACLDDYREVVRLETLLSNYCDLAVSVDYTNAANMDRNDRISRLCAETNSKLSFIDSELGQADEKTLCAAMEASRENRGYLADVLRSKPHRLHPEAERVLAALSQTMQTPYQIYNIAKLSDMQFDAFTVNGKTYPLGYSLFEDDYEYEADTSVRRAAAVSFAAKLREYANVTAAAYNAQVQKEKSEATLRGFDSVIDYLLFPQKVTRDMYDRQIDLIMTHLAPHMRRYAKLLARIHGLDKMTFADLKIAVDPAYDPHVSIEEAKKYVENGLSVMGEAYVDMVRDALEHRWVDFARNVGKSTGGFCASPYGKNSYILLTWNERMADVFTLAHELGHAGHFKACNAAQSILDTDVSTYFVEAPSTINELLFAHQLLRVTDDPRHRRWVLSMMIGDTYYHNFVTHLLEAAYQREVYRIVDAGGSVSAETLSGIMKKMLETFWGDAVEISDDAALTWMRQPHYYMGLYSYTYSAGLTVATQVCKRIEREGQPAVDAWKQVLASGSTLDPKGLAALAGVDISTDAPLRDTIETIGGIITELEQLTDVLEAKA